MSQTDKQPTIKLSQHDLNKCIGFTDLYFADVDKYNRQQKYGFKSRSEKYQDVLQGYLGERAAGKFLNYETVWTPYDPKQYDVLGYEIRTVKYNFAILITHPDDKPGIYICVSMNKNTMIASFKGWSSRKRCNARLSNWQNNINWHTPCFGMPEDQLWPMDTLPATTELIAHQAMVYA